jgi:autotransporter translocation and assembly factor TamB
MRFLRRAGKILLFGLGVLLLLLVALWLLRGPLLSGPLARALERQIAESAGYEVRIGRIGGTWLGDVEVEDVTVTGPGVEGGSLRRVAAAYSLLDLARGRDGWIRSVEVVGLRGTVEPDRLPRSEEEPSPEETEPFEPETLGRHLPVLLDVEDVDVGVRLGGRTFAISDLRLEGRADGLRDAGAELRIASVVLDGPEGTETVSDVVLEATLDGGDAAAKLELALPGGPLALALEAPRLLEGDPILRGELDVPEYRPTGPVAALLEEAGIAIEGLRGSVAFSKVRPADLDGEIRADLGVRGVVAYGRRVGDVALVAEGPLERVRVDLTVREGLGDVDLRGTAGTTGTADLVFEGTVPDLAALGLEELADRTVAGRLAARGRLELRDDSRTVRIEAQGRGLAVDGTAVGDLDLRADATEASAAIELLELRRDGDRVTLRGRADFGDVPVVSLAGDLAVDDLGPWAALAGLEAEGRARGELRVRGPIDDPTGSLALRAEALSVGDQRVEEAVLAASVSPGEITLERLDVRLPDASLRLAARGEHEDWSAFRVRLERLDLAHGDIAAGLQGPARLELDADGAATVRDFRLRGEGATLTLDGGRRTDGSLAARLAVVRLDTALLARFLDAPPPVSGIASLEVRLAGTDDEPVVDATLAVDEPAAELAELESALRSVAVELRIDRRAAELRRLTLETAGGTLRATGKLEATGGDLLAASEDPASIRLAGTVRTEGLDLARVRPLPGGLLLDGTLAIDATVDGDAARPDLVGRIRWTGGSVAGLPDLPPVRGIELDARVTNEAAEVVALRAEAAGATLGARGTCTLDGGEPRAVDLVLDASAPDLARLIRELRLEGLETVRGDAGVAIRVAGSVDDPRLSVAVTSREIVWADAPPGRIDIRVRAEEGTAAVDELHVDLPGGRIVGKASLPAKLSLWPPALKSAPLRELDGEIRAGRLDDSGALVDGIDLATLGELLPESAGVRRLTGRAGFVARHRPGGRLDRPEAELWLRDLGVRLADRRRAVTELDAHAKLADGVLRLTKLSGRLGHAPIEASGTWETTGAGRLDAELRGDRLLVLNDLTKRLRADLRLRVTGETSRSATISGDVVLRDLLYTENVRFLDFESRPALATLPLSTDPLMENLNLDLRVTGFRKLRIRNNVLRADLRMDLRVRGTAAYPLLDGRVETRPGGRLSIPGATLRIQNADLDFRPSEAFRPFIAFTGTAVRQRIRIEVTATGPPDELRIDFDSDAGLPREDVITLLTTGVVRSELTAERAGQAAAMAGAGVLLDELLGSSKAVAEEDETTVQWLLREASERTDVAMDSVPGGRHSIITASVRLLDWLRLEGERDEYGEYNIDVAFRVLGR